MKVLMINGSPDPRGCIHTAFEEAKKVFEEKGIEAEEIIIGNKDIRGCIGCRRCKTTGKCVFNDLVNETAPKLAEADGVIIGLDNRYALEQVRAGDVLVEYDKLIDRQLERAAITSIAGFGKICDGAACVLNV